MSLFLTVLAFFIALVFTLFAAGAWAKRRLQQAYLPTGQMLDIGGYKLHVNIQGKGDFSVVFDSGAGGIAAYWEKVQAEIASYAVTLSYDRAGLGWSDVGRQPRSFEVMVEELEKLLKAADIPTPYVLVGHSLGGIVLRQFAKAHPEQVAGIVLVDSAHEEQFTKRFPLEVRQMAAKMVNSMQPMVWAFASGIPALLIDKLPLTTWVSDTVAESERAIRVMSSKHMRTVLAEMDSVINHPPQPVNTLGDIPLIILVHGVAQPVPNLSDTVNADYETAWQQMQHDLVLLSANSRHIIAEQSGHDIPLQQPELVTQAIASILSGATEASQR